MVIAMFKYLFYALTVFTFSFERAMDPGTIAPVGVGPTSCFVGGSAHQQLGEIAIKQENQFQIKPSNTLHPQPSQIVTKSVVPTLNPNSTGNFFAFAIVSLT